MSQTKKKNYLDFFLNFVEKIGNMLPHPVILFLILGVITILLSSVLNYFNINVTYTGFNRNTNTIEEMTVYVKNLLNPEGIRYLFSSFVRNYVNYAPLGLLLVTIVGIGIVEDSGLLELIIKKIIRATNIKFITVVLVFLGVMSNVASDALGYLVLIPIGAKIFQGMGRHPLAGFAATFFGVSGGFAANLLLGPGDALLSGISTEAIKILNPSLEVLATSNWYFMIASTFLITFIGTIITEKIVEPRLGKYDGVNDTENSLNINESITAENQKGLFYAGISLLLFIILLLILCIPKNGILRVNGKLDFYLSNGLVPTMMLFFMIPGTIFGIINKKISSSNDIATMMIKSLSGVGGFLALALFAAQFISYFNYTNLGIILAVKGATFLKSFNIVGIPLIILFVLLTCFINLFMGSASAKWSIMAPVFIPMFYQLGYSPEFTQLIFRIGDSSTNVISPLMSYFAVILIFLQKYNKKSGIGNLISLMLPYSIATLLSWLIMLIIWFIFNLPIGPGNYLFI
ncbi:MAG: AbgT family transporter [Fusobacteriaceae bacterium]